MVGNLPKSPEVVERLSQMSGSGQEILPDVRKWSEDPPESPEVVERLSQKSGSGRETFPEVRKWSGNAT